MIETTWDTEEVSRIICNDEHLYNVAIYIANESYDLEELAREMEGELTDSIISYNDIDLDMVDWDEIATEYEEFLYEE